MSEKLPNLQPERTLIQAEAIPTSITCLPHWVLWQYEPRKDGGKPHKTPYSPSGAHADVTNPGTWCSFESVLEAYNKYARYSGIGFVLTKDTPIVGVDIDDCIEHGNYSPHAIDIMQTLESYTEISPSGNGLRILVEAELGEFAGRRKAEVELYNYGRYLSITGNHVASTPTSLQPRLEELRQLYKHYLADPKAHSHDTQAQRLAARETETPDDTEVLKRMFEGKQGYLYRDIYEGDIRSVYGQDESRADTLLFNGLAYYTKCDPFQMRRILLNSPRFTQRGAKWYKQVQGETTYLDYQIQNSIAYTKTR